jgi:hypothetical protein
MDKGRRLRVWKKERKSKRGGGLEVGKRRMVKSWEKGEGLEMGEKGDG